MEAVTPPELADRMIVIGAPPGHEDDVAGLPALIENEGPLGRTFRSYWRLSPAEIGELARGGCLRLSIHGQEQHPVVSLVTVCESDPSSTTVPE